MRKRHRLAAILLTLAFVMSGIVPRVTHPRTFNFAGKTVTRGDLHFELISKKLDAGNFQGYGCSGVAIYIQELTAIFGQYMVPQLTDCGTQYCVFDVYFTQPNNHIYETDDYCDYNW